MASESGRAPLSPARRAVLVVLVWVALAALCACGVILYSYWQQQNSYEQVAASALDEGALAAADELAAGEGGAGDASDAQKALYSVEVDWDALREVNPDVVGWVYIPGTRVNYPVVQADDNDYYLYYNFDGARASNYLPTAGTPFLLAENAPDFSDGNSVIQAHNMANGTMFHDVGAFRDPDEFNEHRTAFVFTPAGNYKLTGISVLVIPADDKLVRTSFADEDDYAAFVAEVMERSAVEVEGALPDAADIWQTFMLSTCESAGSAYRTVAVYAATDYAAMGKSDAAKVKDAMEGWG